MAITKAPLLKFCSRKKCLAELTGTLATVHFASLMLESSPSNGGIFGEISGNLVFHFRSAASAPAVHHSRDTPNAHGMGIRELTGSLLSNTERASVYACSEKRSTVFQMGWFCGGKTEYHSFLQKSCTSWPICKRRNCPLANRSRSTQFLQETVILCFASTKPPHLEHS